LVLGSTIVLKRKLVRKGIEVVIRIRLIDLDLGCCELGLDSNYYAILVCVVAVVEMKSKAPDHRWIIVDLPVLRDQALFHCKITEYLLRELSGGKLKENIRHHSNQFHANKQR